MSKQTQLFITQKVRTPMAQITAGDTTSLKTLYTASAEDAIVKSIHATSVDTVARVVQVVVIDGTGTVQRILGSVSIPANSGTNGSAASVDLLNAVMMPGLVMDQNGKRVLPLEAGYKVAVRSNATVTGNLDIVAVVEEY